MPFKTLDRFFFCCARRCPIDHRSFSPPSPSVLVRVVVVIAGLSVVVEAVELLRMEVAVVVEVW